MSLIVTRSKKQYEIAAEGTHEATLQEIRELGKVETSFGAKEKLLFIWEVEQVDSKGEPVKVFQRFTKSLHPKAALYKAVRSITGEDPGDEFDLSKLIGTSVQLVIQHNESDDGVIYANVAAILRVQTPEEEASEKRVQAVIDAARKRQQEQEPITDLDVPF